MAFHRKIWEVTPLSAAIVPLPDLKAMCRVDHADEDDLISSFGLAAAARVEKITQKLLSPRQIILRAESLPMGRLPIALRGGPVQSVASVVIDGTAFAGCVAFGDAPAQLIPPADWPIVSGDGFPVVVTYVAGYPTPPADLLVAVKIIAADLFDRKSDDPAFGDYSAPRAAASLIEPHRVLAW